MSSGIVLEGGVSFAPSPAAPSVSGVGATATFAVLPPHLSPVGFGGTATLAAGLPVPMGFAATVALPPGAAAVGAAATAHFSVPTPPSSSSSSSSAAAPHAPHHAPHAPAPLPRSAGAAGHPGSPVAFRLEEMPSAPIVVSLSGCDYEIRDAAKSRRLTQLYWKLRQDVIRDHGLTDADVINFDLKNVTAVVRGRRDPIYLTTETAPEILEMRTIQASQGLRSSSDWSTFDQTSIGNERGSAPLTRNDRLQKLPVMKEIPIVTHPGGLIEITDPTLKALVESKPAAVQAKIRMRLLHAKHLHDELKRHIQAEIRRLEAKKTRAPAPSPAELQRLDKSIQQLKELQEELERNLFETCFALCFAHMSADAVNDARECMEEYKKWLVKEGKSFLSFLGIWTGELGPEENDFAFNVGQMAACTREDFGGFTEQHGRAEKPMHRSSLNQLALIHTAIGLEAGQVPWNRSLESGLQGIEDRRIRQRLMLNFAGFVNRYARTLGSATNPLLQAPPGAAAPVMPPPPGDALMPPLPLPPAAAPAAAAVAPAPAAGAAAMPAASANGVD